MSPMRVMEPSVSLKDRIRELHAYSACDVSDALLKLQETRPGQVARAGYFADIVPYPARSDQPKIIGPASTLKLVSKSYSIPHIEADTVPKGSHWVDMTDPGTVVVIEQPEGQKCAAVGGIMALRMQVRGVLGCVVSGRVRDLEELADIGLPIWARAQSTVGAGAENRVYARNVDIDVGGVSVSPNDIVFCDPSEGVVIIPHGQFDDVLALMPKLVAADDNVKEDIRLGMSVSAAFEKNRA